MFCNDNINFMISDCSVFAFNILSYCKFCFESLYLLEDQSDE